jgi:hypothetical protein
MAIVSALQQASISRLQVTFQFVPEEDTEIFNNLKVLSFTLNTIYSNNLLKQILMAGNKNYQNYREELNRLQTFLFAFEENIDWKMEALSKIEKAHTTEMDLELDLHENQSTGHFRYL